MNDHTEDTGGEPAAQADPPVGADRPGAGPLPPGDTGNPSPADCDQSARRRSSVVYLVRDHAGDPAQAEIATGQDTAGDPSTDPSAGGIAPGAGSAASTDRDTRPGAPIPRSGDDWPWVAEWRAAGEPTPWATGLVLAAFSALLVAVAVWVLAAGLSDRPVVAVLVNLLVAAGLTPAMWLSRDLPVLRWIAGGALVGILCGWVAAVLMLPVAR